MERRLLTNREVREYKAVVRALASALHFCPEEDASLVRCYVGRMLMQLTYDEECKSAKSGKDFNPEKFFEEALNDAKSCY